MRVSYGSVVEGMAILTDPVDGEISATEVVDGEGDSAVRLRVTPADRADDDETGTVLLTPSGARVLADVVDPEATVACRTVAATAVTTEAETTVYAETQGSQVGVDVATDSRGAVVIDDDDRRAVASELRAAAD